RSIGMEALIEFIFSNFIIILIILGGIAKLFGYDKNEEEQKKKTSEKRKTATNNQPSPKTTSHQRRETYRQAQPGSKTSSSSTSTASIGEQQQKQLEQLAGKMKTVGDQTFEELSEKIPVNRDMEHHAIPLHKMNNAERNTVHNKNKTEVK